MLCSSTNQPFASTRSLRYLAWPMSALTELLAVYWWTWPFESIELGSASNNFSFHQSGSNLPRSNVTHLMLPTKIRNCTGNAESLAIVREKRWSRAENADVASSRSAPTWRHAFSSAVGGLHSRNSMMVQSRCLQTCPMKDHPVLKCFDIRQHGSHRAQNIMLFQIKFTARNPTGYEQPETRTVASV
jgi:hypothetical protein